MQPMTRTRHLVIAIAIIASMTVLAWAAPMKPKRGDTRQQWRSLAAVKRIRLVVDRIDEPLAQLGVSGTEIHDRWSRRLQKSGLVVTDDPASPQLRLIISAVTEDQLPNAVAFNPYLALEQSVRINGLDHDLETPTYVSVTVGLDTRSKVAVLVNRTVDRMLDKFIAARDRAQARR